MKRTATLLFLFACGCAVNVQAKTTKSTAVSPFPHFSNQETGGSSIPINTRLVKKTRYKHTGVATSAVPSEEVLYEYNSDRGSLVDIYDQNDDDVQYDVSYTNGIQGSEIQKQLKREQNYNSSSQVLQLVHKSWKNAAYQNAKYYEYVYNPQYTNIIDHVNLYLYPGGPPNTVPYRNYTDGQGNVVFMEGVTYFIEFSYDANNRLLTQIDYNGSQSAPLYNEKDSFVYDGQNQVIGMYIFKMNNGWKMDQFWQYTYSANNDLDMITKRVWTGSAFKNDLLQTFGYANENRIYDATDKWNSTTNSYDHLSKMTWSYNLNHQPTQLNTYTWLNGGWNTSATDYQIKWEYQTYFPTSVYDVNNDLNTNIYPVPAQESLNIALSWKKMQPFNIAIMDMTGRTITQWDETAIQEYHKNVPVRDMPSGNYFVVLTGKDGLRSTQKFQVAH